MAVHCAAAECGKLIKRKKVHQKSLRSFEDY